MASFSIQEFPKVVVHIQKGMKAATERGLMSAAQRLVQIIQVELIPAEEPQPVNTGAFRAAWHAEKTPGGADVVNTMPYASIIEYGARAENIKIGRAMIEALARWVELKGLAGKKAGASRAAKAEQIAWAIAVSMKKKGIFNRGGKQGLRIAEKAAARAGAIVAEEIVREKERELG